MKKVRLFGLLILTAVMVSLIAVPGMVLAQDEEPPVTDNTTEPPPEPVLISEPEVPPDAITMTTEFPKIEAIATSNFEFKVEMNYQGSIDRTFDLNVKVPVGWDAYINPQYDSIRISSIVMESSFAGTRKTVKITARGPTFPIAEPGEYPVILEAVSDEVVGSIELTADVTARYSLRAVPANERYNTTARAGEDNIYSIEVANLGTDTIENVTFSSTSPDGWEIVFEPNKIDVIEILDPKSVNVNIKPPPKTVAGDYMVTLRVSGTEASADSIDVRVTVRTPTVWGWVGVGIIVVVVVGLIFIFMRFGRR